MNRSIAAGRRWIVCNDEQNPASDGVPPDPGYQGHDGVAAKQSKHPYTLHDIRRCTLWGTLLAGGEGVEYYFGYQLPENDLLCQDFRSRDQSWDYCRIALQFFHTFEIPFWKMQCHDALVGNPQHDNSRYCFAHPGEIYLVYLPEGQTCEIDLSEQAGKTFEVAWFNPRTGGELTSGSVASMAGGKRQSLGQPPVDDGQDWLAVLREKGVRTQ